MEDRVIYKGGNHVIANNTEGRIKLIQPVRGTLNKFIRWWNRTGNQYIDCGIFRVELNNGTAVRLVIPHVKGGMQIEIRHDGYGNFTFPKCRLERIAVVSIDTTDVLVEYQFSKISGGSVLKRTLAGLPEAPQPAPEAAEPPAIQVIIQPEAEAPPADDAQETDSDDTSDEDIIEVTTTVEDLKKMTKKQLLSWASDLGYDLVDNHIKAQLLDECIDILEDSN